MWRKFLVVNHENASCRKTYYIAERLRSYLYLKILRKYSSSPDLYIIPLLKSYALIFKEVCGIIVVRGGDFMLRVAVCDDIQEVVAQITGYLDEYQRLNNCLLDVNPFFNAEELWEHLINNSCDLVILDIELIEMNGVELGHLIRTELNDHTMKIVYISAMDCYDRQLFEVQPLNFLPKPIDKEKLFKMIDLTVELLSDTERFFVFENKQGSFRMKFNNILYFESFDHNIKIETVSGSYEFKSTLSEVMKQLSNSRFLQVHRSYIINYNNISHIKYEEITMSNGDKIPVSRDRRKEVRKIISEWEGVGVGV